MSGGSSLGSLALIVAALGCYQPAIDPCAVTCEGPGSACPGATSCGDDGYCHAAGEPRCTAHDAGPVDAPDAAPPDANADLLAGCAVRLTMDEASWSGAPGEVIDACGGDDSGTAIGVTTAANGVSGRAGDFPGGTACVVIPDSTRLHALQTVTLSAWVRPTALDGVASFGVISKRNDVAVDDEYDVFLWTDDRVWVDIASNDNRFAAPAQLVNGVWQHVAVVYDGARAVAERVRVYVDGDLVGTAQETSPAVPSSDADLHVGCLPVSSPTQGFIGQIDEVVIWQRALSDAEVMAWYDATRP